MEGATPTFLPLVRHRAGGGGACQNSPPLLPFSRGRSLHSDPWREGNRVDEEAEGEAGALTTSGALCARDFDSGSNNTNVVRVETGAVVRHGTGDIQQPVGHRTQSERMGVAAGA